MFLISWCSHPYPSSALSWFRKVFINILSFLHALIAYILNLRAELLLISFSYITMIHSAWGLSLSKVYSHGSSESIYNSWSPPLSSLLFYCFYFYFSFFFYSCYCFILLACSCFYLSNISSSYFYYSNLACYYFINSCLYLSYLSYSSCSSNIFCFSSASFLSTASNAC